ncbi:hypothetical protein [Nonomuraea longicatena]|uniref:DUF4352 domain-containing protein n=1 Tax=Nonomuraea longicatena TaxID=83682 RepID=A0ABN1NL90_9ACTN
MRQRAWFWFAAIAAVILLPVAIAWPLGGLADAARAEPARYSLGQPIKGQRHHLVPRRAVFTTKDPSPAFGVPRKGRFVVLDLEVTNVSSLPSLVSQLSGTLAVGLDGRPAGPVLDQSVVRAGGRAGDVLNPGIPETVRLSWEVDEAPERMSVAVTDEVREPSWSLLGYASGTSLWYMGETPMGVLETPLERE